MRTNCWGVCETCVVVYTYMVEHLEELGTGLVDGADDGAAALRQRLEQRQTLEARRAVQTAVITRQHIALIEHIHKHGQLYKYGQLCWGIQV